MAFLQCKNINSGTSTQFREKLPANIKKQGLNRMRNLSILNASMLAGFMAATPHATADAPSSEHPLNRTSVSASVTDGCHMLYDDSCGGSKKRIEWRSSETSWGTMRIGVETFRESMGKTFFERSFKNSVADGAVTLDWAADIKGTRVTFNQEFRLGRNAAIEVGAFVSRVSVNASAHGDASLNVYPRTITSPAASFMGYSIPPMSYDFKGYEFARQYAWEKHGKSPNGGVHARAAWAMGFTPSLRAGVSAFGEAAMTRRQYSIGTALYYSSSFDNRLGTTPGGECSGQPLRSSARWAFSLGACVTKIHSDRIVDEQMKYAGKTAARINGFSGRMDAQLDQVRSQLPEGMSLPSVATAYTAEDAGRWMGFRTDYRKAQPSLVASASVRLGERGTVSVSHMQGRQDAVTTVAFGWSLK